MPCEERGGVAFDPGDLPEGGAALSGRGFESGQSAEPGQGIEFAGSQGYALDEVGQVEKSGLVPFGLQPVARGLPESLDEAKTQAKGRGAARGGSGLEIAAPTRLGDVDSAHLDPVALGVLDQGGGTVEPHGPGI